MQSPWHTEPPSYEAATEDEGRTPLLWSPSPAPPNTPSGSRSRRKSFAERLMSPYRQNRTRQCSYPEAPAFAFDGAVRSPFQETPQAREAPTPRSRARAHTTGGSLSAFAIRSTETLVLYPDPFGSTTSRMTPDPGSRSLGMRSERSLRPSASCSILRASTRITAPSFSPMDTCEEHEVSGATRLQSPEPMIMRKIDNLTALCIFCDQPTWQCANARNTTGFITIPNIYIQVEAKDRIRLRDYLRSKFHSSEGNTHEITIPMYLVSYSNSQKNRVQVQVSLAIPVHGAGEIPVVHICDAKMEEISRSLRDEVNEAWVTKVPTRVCLVDEVEDVTAGAFLVLRD